MTAVPYGMKQLAPRSRHSKVTDAEEQADPAMLPVEPDEGPVPAGILDDPEHDRQVDPET